MNTKKTSKTPSPQSLTFAFKSFVMDASDKELKEALESADEDGDSLVDQADGAITRALGRTAESASNKSSVAKFDRTEASLHEGLSTLVRLLRRKNGLSESELAEAARVDVNEIRLIEFDVTYSPNPRTIYQLERYFRLEPRSLAMMSVVRNQSKKFADQVHSFAAQSKEIGKLTREESKLLNSFVRFLAEAAKKSSK